MKVLLVGHSYVYQLRRQGDLDRVITLENGQEVKLEFSYLSKPGKDYNYFNENPIEFEYISRLNPDIVVVILGGNLIVESFSIEQLKKEAAEFYGKLQEVVRSGCLRLAVQVEPRYAEAGNRFGTPQQEEFNKRRQLINNYIKKLKRDKFIDNLVLLGSKNHMDISKYKADGVHLNEEGLNAYSQCLLSAIRYALERQ